MCVTNEECKTRMCSKEYINLQVKTCVLLCIKSKYNIPMCIELLFN